VYRVLYEQISESLKSQNRVNENIFDIIAGTSIGAINAAISVSHVVENKKKQNPSWYQLRCWENSADKLEFSTDPRCCLDDHIMNNSKHAYNQPDNQLKC
jgi:predicted acylesterase/phospholipase RssA